MSGATTDTEREAGAADTVRTVLLPTDGSEGAEAAVAHAVSLAQTYGATIHVLAVADTKSYGTFTTGGAGTVISALEGRCREHVAATRELIADLTSDDPDSPAVETAVVRGFPAEEILRYAEEHDADLLVMGTHGRTGVGRVLLGSVTERVVRRARIPVVTVRQSET
ncbi:universal stress protein [Salinirubrum litoreum]|uniref:Universal stress protein n=1 Tax=Salinirubrum litoreum TaxID=1126234 RepID=A0ABD5RC71_9EURY|nr:universal stress protein [Salinirubrum litoreum]